MVIAEIGTSHSGCIEKAKALIDGAKEAGADAVKFQWVYANEILHPKTGFVDLPTGRIPLYDRFKSLECPPAFYAECLSYAHSRGLLWCCSPFGLRSLRELFSIKPDAIKIASPELNHFPLLGELKRLCDSGTRVIISSGVSKLKDIEAALETLKGLDVTLLHCITSYPAPEEEYNVRLVSTLRKIFGVKTGISDHSLDPVLVPVLAASQGALVTEKHITLSNETDGLDDPVALTVEQFSQMTMALRQARAALAHYGPECGEQKIISQMEDQFGSERVQKVLGNGVKALAPAEEKNYGRTNRSLHYMEDFECGHVLKEGDVGVLRTEKILTPGLSPDFYKAVIGKKLKKSVQGGQGILLEDLLEGPYSI